MNAEDNLNERGVIFLEFTIAASIIVVVFLISLDLYLSFYRFLLLSDATNVTARNFSLLLEGGESQLQTNANNLLTSYLRNTFNQNTQNISVVATKVNHGTYCTLQINSKWQNSCVLCSFTQITPQAFQEVIIEDECEC